VVHEISTLSIVIINWNCGDFLRRCVERIIQFSPAVPFEIIVIDNSSSDQSLDHLSQSAFAAELIEQERLRIVRNHANLGFGKANNQAFKLSKTPFVFLLNPDAEVSSGTIDTLLASLTSSADIGACGPRILNQDGSVQVSVWRNPTRVWQIVLSNLKLSMLLPRRIRGEMLLGGHWAHDTRRMVPMLSGAAMLVRREVIDSLGGFDERFDMYGEDHEWCLRMSRAGWKLLFEPAAVVVHHDGQSGLKRWTNLEKVQVKLEAEYLFETLTLPRWRVRANRLTSYLVTSIQKAWRDIRGIKLPELDLIKKLHWKHFRETFKSIRPSRHPQTSKARADADTLA
jgi:GT2 family glycosyltransferase